MWQGIGRAVDCHSRIDMKLTFRMSAGVGADNLLRDNQDETLTQIVALQTISENVAAGDADFRATCGPLHRHAPALSPFLP